MSHEHEHKHEQQSEQSQSAEPETIAWSIVLHQARYAKLTALLRSTCAVTVNDQEIPAEPERYLVLELENSTNEDSDVIAFETCQSLTDAVTYINESQTQRDGICLIDLDKLDMADARDGWCGGLNGDESLDVRLGVVTVREHVDGKGWVTAWPREPEPAREPASPEHRPERERQLTSALCSLLPRVGEWPVRAAAELLMEPAASPQPALAASPVPVTAALRPLTDSELATVLHSLRLLQETRQALRIIDDPAEIMNLMLAQNGCMYDEYSRATQPSACDHFDSCDDLTESEIDSLCERLNLDSVFTREPSEQAAVATQPAPAPGFQDATDEQQRALLEAYFPYIGTSDQFSGSEVINRLNEWWQAVGGTIADDDAEAN